ncbi:hypothetical protein K2173_021280 [Erythroxylum novogranatense]|uniref:22alpha-hydroxysteroid 23-monooxygenase n=1 Tax=Erythroxylum novogranatense TaxID=1862640 RepID=A0AAV8TWY9_9ROSI|nr:hypothetical protein K2173_021280 [Erythroxylum novogranatense]
MVLVNMEWATVWWVIVVIVVGWFWYWKAKFRVEKKYGVPKGSLGWPFIGETFDFIACGYTSQPVSFMEKRKSLYGKVFKTHILGTPIIVSTDPEVNKAVLQNHGNTFVPAYPKSIRELMGEHSILQMNGNLQRRVHGIICRFLKSSELKTRITKDIENSVNHTLASWKHKTNDLIYVQNEVKKITFPVLVKVLISISSVNDLNFLKTEFDEFIKGLICLPIKLPGTRLYKSLKAKERMFKMVKNIVEERKLAMEKQSVEYKRTNISVTDAVDALLRDSDEANERTPLPLDFIAGNIIEMMIPGEETMPTAMTLAVKFLSDCPVALRQLKEENMELKRKRTSSCDEYSWTDYMSLTFTQDVISETLRLANIINAVWRKAVKDVEIKGNLIPEGWCVLTSFTSVHMNEEYHENPYQFDPWRWEKTGAAVVNNCFTPFGGGQRLCPGLELSRLEIAVFLHHLTTSFGWVAEKDKIVYFPTVRMKRKLPIKVTDNLEQL